MVTFVAVTVLLAIPGQGVCQQPRDTAKDTPAAAYAREVSKALIMARPSGAGLKGLSGLVKIKFTLSSEGHVKSAEVLASSGDSKLDAFALQAVRRAIFPRPPRELTPDQLTFETSYHFMLGR
jgi:TonB family protein